MRKKRKNGHRLLPAVLAVLLLVFSLPVSAEEVLIPGGFAVGVRLRMKEVTVVGLSEVEGETGKRAPAKDAGIRTGDHILRVNDGEIGGAEDVTEAIQSSGGAPLKLTVRRNKQLFSCRLCPAADRDGCWKGGLWLRDCTSGIGTVTYLEPETGAFGGLGHGICEKEGEAPAAFSSASVLGATICGAEAGKPGIPGQLRGYFGANVIGSLTSNTEKGIFGVLTALPDALPAPVPVAAASQVHPGKATILCTPEGNSVRSYEIELRSVDLSPGTLHNFVLRVTDPALLAKTGGIVQGMSGSPILQDGRLVGAVTHVLISDPRAGYGIFIGNMRGETSGGREASGGQGASGGQLS